LPKIWPTPFCGIAVRARRRIEANNGDRDFQEWFMKNGTTGGEDGAQAYATDAN